MPSSAGPAQAAAEQWPPRPLSHSRGGEQQCEAAADGHVPATRLSACWLRHGVPEHEPPSALQVGGCEQQTSDALAHAPVSARPLAQRSRSQWPCTLSQRGSGAQQVLSVPQKPEAVRPDAQPPRPKMSRSQTPVHGAGRRQQRSCSPQPLSARTPPKSQRASHCPPSEAHDGAAIKGAQHSSPRLGQRPSSVATCRMALWWSPLQESRQRPPSAAHVTWRQQASCGPQSPLMRPDGHASRLTHVAW